jgi:TetR/AcrR family tetracycline transcriptional repressor
MLHRMKVARKRRNPRERLSRDRILEAALHLADREGMQRLSMRRLADELGCNPMAVYYYFEDKRALVREVVNHVFSAFVWTANAEDSWQEHVRAWAFAYRSLVLAHPGLVVSILSDEEAVAIAASHVNPSIAGVFGNAGLRGRPLDTAIGLTVDYVHGACLPLASGAIAASKHFEREFSEAVALIVAGVEAAVGHPSPATRGTGRRQR